MTNGTEDSAEVAKRVLTAIREPPMKDEALNIEGWAEFLNFQTFDDPQLKKLVECCALWALRVKHGLGKSWITLMGASGTGKTHCAGRLYRWAHKRCPRQYDPYEIQFSESRVYWPGFIEQLRNGDGYDQLIDMRQWPVLFLDDIGAERDTTGYAAERLNTLLGTRVGKWTIITSNLNLEQLAKIDGRISDRIIREPGNVFIELDTVSYGIRKLKG